MRKWTITGLLLLLPWAAWAAPGLEAVQVTTAADGGTRYTISIQVLALMTALTVLPALLLSMTAFTRIMVVLAILRQALGTGQTPNNQILLGASLLLTLFIMMPVFDQAYKSGVEPYLEEKIEAGVALQRALVPLRKFMLRQTRESDLALFVRLSGREDLESMDDVPLSLLLPAFMTSELKTAFQIGFMLFLPFLVIDLVVASILMSMGMMMLSPVIISLPFKLMLFVLVDGWALVMETLAASFYTV
ncbi:flagellar biosynthetic protein FliP [Methylomarinovum tepidoasis]|uniref:Flagellar biosynthetic protein FliP n=1 Tax=Methylomarinovum tepidoasis TaxID=2840183 RepID=A0AAU9C6L4_9GAMM|nr:flagellar type III secretion system pore protein FliP [Methylomarinovum sp. IN45]BCX89202.1 flagellar biosynthetic protein FliP [Methylomarinovum sp. IN45]